MPARERREPSLVIQHAARETAFSIPGPEPVGAPTGKED